MGEREIRFGQSVPAIVLLGLALAAPARCQQVADATLTIRFVNDQQQFHVGEAIPIELAFTSFVEKTYQISLRDDERSEWLGSFEQFHVSPPGRDPMRDYYDAAPVGGIGGDGISSGPRYLGNKPEIIYEDLNEWVALDHPGQCALYVTSSRVNRRVGSKMQTVPLRSNTLYFDVVKADAAWQKQTLDSAVATLGDPESSQGDRRSALRTLRFLDSPGSVRELVREIGKPGNEDSWDCLAGLMGSTHRRLVAGELQAQVAAPDTAITSTYIRALAVTRLLPSREPLTAYPSQGKQQQKEWMASRSDRMKQFQQAEDALYTRAAALVAAKEGRAKAETVETLLSFSETGPAAPKPWKSLPSDTLASAFLLLPPGEQTSMLEIFWDRLKTPPMAGALESILDQPRVDVPELRVLALQRLYDLDPGEGAARILDEIRQPHADIMVSQDAIPTLDSLPDKTLPQFDSLLATRLEKRDGSFLGLTAQLIGRYSTKAILPRVKAVYLGEQGKGGCSFNDGLMIYFLRVDPDFAVRQMTVTPNLCMSDAFGVAVKVGRWPAIEPTVIAKLSGPNLYAAWQAAEVLRLYGGKNAEKALWKRLEEFHAKWVKRAGELQDSPHMPSDAVEAINLQVRLVDALGAAQGWLLDNSEITRLEQLTLGRERDSVAQWHWNSPVELSIDFSFDSRLEAHINGFYYTNDVSSLCAKLAQFPEGTQFYVGASGPRESVAPVLQAIEDAAQEDGLYLKVVNGSD